MLGLTALLGGCIGAALSHVPGKRKASLLTGLLLTAAAPALLLAGLCLYCGSTALRANIDAVYPDRLSKLAGCGLQLLLSCVLGLLAGFVRSKGPRRFFRRVCGLRLPRLALAAAAAAALGIVLGCYILAGDPPDSPFRISEVCCANFLRADPDNGECVDFIELCNVGDEPANLAGCYLSDNGKKRRRFCLPDLDLKPGECVLVWADNTGKSGTAGENAIHLNFTLQAGETVWLSSPNGLVLDYVTLPRQPRRNVSMTRMEEGWTEAYATPGRSNENAERYVRPTLDPPQLSLPAGFYDEPQTLCLTADPGCEIRYTLDGSVPTADSLLYTEPLLLTDVSPEPNRVLNHPSTTKDRSGVITEPVDKGTQLRACAFSADGQCSEIVTAVYFVGRETFAKYEGSPVLNIVADPEDLFGKRGICVTGSEYDKWLEAGGKGDEPWPYFYRKGPMLERDAEVELWDAAHEPVLEEACGIRLQGDHTRAQAFKRFRLIARELYSGSKYFSAELFGDYVSHSFFTRLDSADLIAQSLAEGLGLGGLDGFSAAVFVNGEYYYTAFLRERYDRQYFAAHFGVDEDELVLISNDKLDQGTEADYEDYCELMDYIASADCADPAVWAEICSRIDVRNYADYVALNIYCNNTDWCKKKNYKLWRTRKARDGGWRDGRWRWLVYDMDGCTWSADKYGYHKAEFDAFLIKQPYGDDTFLEMPLFSDLLENPEFRRMFAASWLELMNLVLTPEHAEALLERYGVTDDSFWLSFLRKRPPYAAEILIRDLELDAAPCAVTLTLSDPAGGSLSLNGTRIPITDGSWTGTWISGLSLSLRAEPAPGWRFAGWRLDGGASQDPSRSADPTLSLTPAGDLTLTAVFERDG